MEDQKIEQWTCGDYSYENDVKNTRSGPVIKLTELEQQLEVAESRCGSLKSQLDYMKMLYQGVQPSTTELIPSPEQHCLPTQLKDDTQSSPREKVLKVIADEENCQQNTTAAVEDIQYYQYLKDIQKMQEVTRELDSDLDKKSLKQFLKSPNITPRLNERHYTALEKERESISAECRYTKQIHKTHKVQGAATEEHSAPMSILTSLTAAATSIQIPEIFQIWEEHDAHNAIPFQYPTDYPAWLQNDFTNSTRNLTSHCTSENKSQCRENEFVEQKHEIKKQELVLKLSESMDSAPITVKRKRVIKVEKKQKTGLSAGSVVKKALNSKCEDTLSVTSNNKSKRRKGKLRNAHSKNIVITKDANLTERRDSKKQKQKQKGFSSATHMPNRIQPPIHVLRTKAEVVEIYHNNAVEGGSGSISVSSSKHSKRETADQLQSNNVLSNKGGAAQMCSIATYRQQQMCNQQHSLVSDQRALQRETNVRATMNQNTNEEKNCMIQDLNGEEAKCCSAPYPSRYCDPTITRNYELPTVASKLKKVNRSYFSRFNFRNIPFVVGTSVTPSHNLGLNIQQVLSIMKTRQPMTSGMTPLLIHKMSKRIKPVSTLLNHINDSCYSPKLPHCVILGKQNNSVPCGRPKTTTECTTSIDGTVNSRYTGCFTAQSERLQIIPTTQTNSNEKTSLTSVLRKKEEMPEKMKWIQQQESECTCCTKKSKSYNRLLKQYTSRKSIRGNPALTAGTLLKERQEEINIGDNQYNQTNNVSGKTKGIREVLINLHDQFEELSLEYEKLQEQAINSNDQSIIKQAAALEKELNAKEDEINAVVGLYKEVLNLKQQVNSIHGKDRFVYVTTSNNPLSPVMAPPSGHNRTRSATNPMQIFGMRSKGNSIHEPATATRLTGLLREIQSFQKQLLTL